MQRPRIVGRYDYRDENGNILYWKVRLEPGRNGRRKEFRFFHGDNATGRGGNPVAYNLPGIIQAKAIVITEGEKQADVVNKWKIPQMAATSLDSGSDSKLPSAMFPHFEGKRVAILRDNDEAGLRYAKSLAETLHVICEAVKIVLLPHLPEKGDVCDWIKNVANTPRKCMQVIRESPDYVPEPKQPEPSKRPLPKDAFEDSDIETAKQYPVDRLIEFKGGFANCLWHEEKTGSLHLVNGKNRVKCFGCGKSADAIEVHMKISGLSFRDAVKNLQ